MAAELKEALGESAELIESSGGVFEVQFRGKLIYSKRKLGRFPEEGEVVRTLKPLVFAAGA